MIFVLKREGIDDKRWEFEPGKLMSVEVIEIEKRTGMKYPEWLDAFRAGSMLAIHAFVFVMTKRERPGVKWDEIRFTFDDTGWDVEDSDLEEIRTKLAAKIATGEPLTEDELELLEQVGPVEPAEPGEGETPKD